MADRHPRRDQHRCCWARRRSLQITAPGAFPVDPFFFLIGLTYALSVVYASTLRFAERHRWLVDVQLAARRAASSRPSSTSRAASPAISRRSTCCRSSAASIVAVPPRRPAGRDPERAALRRRSCSRSTSPRRGCFTGAVARGGSASLPPRSVAQYTVALNVFGFFAVALLSGSLADRLRTAGLQLERASTEIADLQAFNQHVIDSLTSGLRRPTDRPHPHLQPRGGSDHRRSTASVVGRPHRRGAAVARGRWSAI